MRVSIYALIAGVLTFLIAAGVLPSAASAGSQGKSTKHVRLVFGHPIRLTVSLQEWSRAKEPNGYTLLGKGTTQDRSTISQVADVLNQVNFPNLRHTCPKLPGSRSILRFGYDNGDVWTVYEGGCLNFSAHGIFGTGIGDPPDYALLPVLLGKIAGVPERENFPNRVLAAQQPVETAWTVRQTLAFCATRPRTRGRAANVRGFYYAFPPGAGLVAFGELLSSRSQVRKVLQSGSIPGHIGFGILVSIPLVPLHQLRLSEPRSHSWLTLTGQLTCYRGTLSSELNVRRYRYG